MGQGLFLVARAGQVTLFVPPSLSRAQTLRVTAGKSRLLVLQMKWPPVVSSDRD